MEIEAGEWVYLAGLILGIAIRIWYTKDPVSRDVIEGGALERALLGLIGIGMFVLPLVTILTPWLDPLDYHLPFPLVLVGAIVYLIAMLLLWRSHADLGRNWTPMMGLRDDHQLVTVGVYSRTRHPMYAAHWLWAISQPILVQNLLGGWLTLLAFAPLYLLRIPREEERLVVRFGDEYLSYAGRTGRVFPRLRRRG